MSKRENLSRGKWYTQRHKLWKERQKKRNKQTDCHKEQLEIQREVVIISWLMLNTWTWDKRKCRCWCCEEKLKLWRGRLKSFTNKMTNYWSAHYSNPQVFFFTITIRYLINPAEIIQPGLWQYRWLYPQMTVTLRQYLFTECSPAIKQVMIVKLLKHNNYSLV